MKNLDEFLKGYRGKKILLVFPHPDDEAYVSGGLLRLAEKFSIKTKLICLTKGGRGILPKNKTSAEKLKKIREKELYASCKILGVDEIELWDFPDAELFVTKNKWLGLLEKNIASTGASIIITFDPSGITGHPDHLVVSKEVFEIVGKMTKKPKLLMRVPDKQEVSFFKDNKVISFALKATHILNYPFSISIKKILAIFAHKSQLKDFQFRLQILEWFLFDNKELYHLVDLKKKYPFKLVTSKSP
jgi:LmbE family N-acetylglucosaminyl deacetylase